MCVPCAAMLIWLLLARRFILTTARSRTMGNEAFELCSHVEAVETSVPDRTIGLHSVVEDAGSAREQGLGQSRTALARVNAAASATSSACTSSSISLKILTTQSFGLIATPSQLELTSADTCITPQRLNRNVSRVALQSSRPSFVGGNFSNPWAYGKRGHDAVDETYLALPAPC